MKFCFVNTISGWYGHKYYYIHSVKSSCAIMDAKLEKKIKSDLSNVHLKKEHLKST
jgi:serine protease inhibitor ecotin